MIRLVVALVLALCAWTNTVWADSYPDRPVHIIVGFGAGGPDTNARILAAQLAAQTGKTFLVLNKPGSTGIVGAAYVSQSRPDGYTLLLTSASIAALPSLNKSLPFDVLKDFIPVSEISTSEASFLVVTPSLPVTDLKSFMAYAKQPGNHVFYGSPGVGTGSHLRMALFASNNGLAMKHIPFKSPGEALVSLMSGEIQALFVTSSQAVPLIKAGKVKALAYDYDTRASFMPDIPTMAQAGARPTDLDSGWTGMFAPANTPPQVIAWLDTQIHQALLDPGVRAKLRNAGLTPVGDSSADFSKAMAKAVKNMGAASKAAGIQPQ